MCTYSRKKIITLIEGVENLCRLCLGDLGDPVPVFNEGQDLCSSLSFRIMMCAGIQLSYEENLPNAICKQCHEQVQMCYTFRKQCQSSYRKLKSHLLALKNKNCERIKAEDHSQEEKIMLHFENNRVPEIKRNLNVPEVVGISSENNLEDCKNNEPVVEEKIEMLQQINEEQVQQAEITNSSTVQEDEIRPDLEISTFLSTVLIELGILEKHGDCVELTDHGVTSLTLEMNEDNTIDLEIVEEDQEATPVQEANPVLKVNESLQENASNLDAEQNFVIQYVTGRYKYKHKKTDKTLEADGGEKHEEESEDDDLPYDEMGVVGPVKAMCSECRKTFASKSSLRRHLRTHSGDRPHVCKICGKRFTQGAILKRHRLTHLDTRPFKCNSCEKSFTQRSGLVAHARAHQPPNKRSLLLHKCPHCTKVFLYPSGLSRHMTMHNGRVYMCGACEKQFYDKSSLLRHLRSCKHQNRTPQAVR